MTKRASSSGGSGLDSTPEAISASSVVRSPAGLAVGPGDHPLDSLDALEQAAELLVVDQRPRPLAPITSASCGPANIVFR